MEILAPDEIAQAGLELPWPHKSLDPFLHDAAKMTFQLSLNILKRPLTTKLTDKYLQFLYYAMYKLKNFSNIILNIVKQTPINNTKREL